MPHFRHNKATPKDSYILYIHQQTTQEALREYI